jgi:hypothetical protein
MDSDYSKMLYSACPAVVSGNALVDWVKIACRRHNPFHNGCKGFHEKSDKITFAKIVVTITGEKHEMYFCQDAYTLLSHLGIIQSHMFSEVHLLNTQPLYQFILAQKRIHDLADTEHIYGIVERIHGKPRPKAKPVV